VFQLEGGGMTRWVTQLKPASVRELAAMVALYRPGPMGEIPKFIDYKFGRAKPTYLDERMEPILRETYGIIVYQDQVLKLVQALAGFSLGKADILRRAMGKKDLKEMQRMQVEFLEGTRKNEIRDEDANKVWELLLPFAGYAFNKAHAVCYAILSHQTAFLKANYPVEYMAALLAVYRTKEDRVTAFIEECRRMKITVLPPDVNASDADFSIEKVKNRAVIRFGLGAIKGVGDGIVEAIIKDRTENGPYSHLFEFCERVRPNGMNKTALDSLIKSGSLDSIDSNRAKLIEHADGAMVFADNLAKSKAAGQDSLFLGEAEDVTATNYPVIPDTDPYGRSEKLAFEKEVLGIYVSDHPLRGLERVLQKAATNTCASIEEAEEGSKVKLAGVIASTRTILTKSGNKMLSMTLEDFTGVARCIVFAGTLEKFASALTKDQVVTITGEIVVNERQGEKTSEIRLFEAKPLEGSLDIDLQNLVDQAGLYIKIARSTKNDLSVFRRLIEDHPGDHEVFIQMLPESDYLPIPLGMMVKPSDMLCAELRKLFGRESVDLRSHGEPGSV